MQQKYTFLLLLLTLFSYGQQQTVTYNINPATFEENTPITITIYGNSINESSWGITNNALYLWSWSYDLNDTNAIDCPTNGTWTNSNETNKFIYNALNDEYTYTLTPNTFYSRTGIGKIGLLVKTKDGTGNKKSQDITSEVGTFQVNLTAPLENSTAIINPSGNITITASNTNGAASYNLLANGTIINTANNTNSYNYTHTGITTNQNYALQVTQGTTTITKKFSLLINPNTVLQTMPTGIDDGINYNTTDTSKATLVLDAPGKDFVYVAGSFNNYQPTASYAMKKDPTSGKFWLDITGLVPGQQYNYQYWVANTAPIANSPALVKTADPYSTLVLSPFDDPTIPSNSYPNLPTYPAGQEREVTVLQTAQTTYNWSAATTNFVKPAKEKLVVYEVLIRDFDANKNFQTLIDRIDYFKNLKVNAIQLMPIMEFEGNEGWGYNTTFHLALDKFYGTANKLKEFIDLCHTNGIAVILDVALNHAYGRNPMVRMWMNDPDNDGWGDPSTENPYFNTVAKHSYGVGSDFNHTSTYTKNYVKRVIKHWIQEYKIDGFRWDLTKGFTQSCTANDETCTNAYQADRVAILKDYADYSWAMDPTHYTIFEHLGTDGEEQQWANYRIAETPSKGVMMWGKLTDAYNQLSMGYNSNTDISRMGNAAHGFTAKRVMGYTESHDEERLMYKNITFGNNSNSGHNVRNLNTALNRMLAIGAISLLVPGPKMIWHFADLGMENSLYTCTDGTLNTNTDGINGDCKLSTKPQPQWTNNWLNNSNRSVIYNNWAKMIDLKNTQAVFSGNYTLTTSSNNITPTLHIFDSNIPTSQLCNVVVLTNFDVTNQNIVPNFPYTGIWHDLIDNSTINVNNVSTPITISAGGFKIYGNQQATLDTPTFNQENTLTIYPNPANNHFTLSNFTTSVNIYTTTGQKIKTFTGHFEPQHHFDISDLTQGIYLVKIFNDGYQKNIRLIKK